MLYRRNIRVLWATLLAASLTGPIAAQVPDPLAEEQARREQRAQLEAEARAVETQRLAQEARAAVQVSEPQAARTRAELRAQERAVVAYEQELTEMRAQLEAARRELERAARNVAEQRLTVVRQWPDSASTSEPATTESNAYRLLTSPSYIVRSDNPGSVLRTLGLASRLWSDMELVPLTEDLGRYFSTTEGLLVIRAPSDDELDLMDGDVIQTISGRPPSSAEHAMRILASFEPGETIELAIMRQGAPLTVAYALPPADND